MIKKIAFSFLLILGFFQSCTKEDGQKYLPHFIEIETPENFPQMELNPENPLSEEGVALGRKLYYDPILSNTGQSCSSCHNQTTSFSEPVANSLAHVNLAWHQSFLWNGAVQGNLEDAMLFEVNVFFNTNVSKLQDDTSYPLQFEKVFGTKIISSKNIAFALAQFVRTMVSANSKFDKFLRGETALSPSELNGMDIFLTERGDCFHCHSIGLLTDNSFHNNGLDDTYDASNWGRYGITDNPADMGKYKTPTLRNIEFTMPYMHDGRFSTLLEVVEFYNSGVHATQYADPIMTVPGKEFGLQLTAQDKADLISFLKTFTDMDFINNPDLSHP